MADNSNLMKGQSPFRTGGDSKMMVFIMAGTVVALLLMLGIGYYFSGLGGGGDETSVTEMTDQFMRELVKGDRNAAEKFCLKDVLKDVGDEYKASTYDIKDVHGAPRSASVDITVSGLQGQSDIRLTFILDDGEWKISGFTVLGDND